MKGIALAVLSAVALAGATAGAQTTMTANRSTGPTFPNPAPADEMRADEMRAIAATPDGSGHGANAVNSEIASLPPPSGLNSDADNSSGVPGPNTGLGPGPVH